MVGTHFIECNSAAKDILAVLYQLRERSGFRQLLTQRRIILRLTETLEFLLIIRGGISKVRHISKVTKISLNHLLIALSLC